VRAVRGMLAPSFCGIESRFVLVVVRPFCSRDQDQILRSLWVAFVCFGQEFFDELGWSTLGDVIGISGIRVNGTFEFSRAVQITGIMIWVYKLMGLGVNVGVLMVLLFSSCNVCDSIDL